MFSYLCSLFYLLSTPITTTVIVATEVGISPGGNGRGLGSNAGNGGVGIGASGGDQGSSTAGNGDVGIGATGGSVGSTVGHGSGNSVRK